MRIAVDIGGTFTDCVVEDGATTRLVKSPTTPDDPVRGVLDAVAKAAGAEDPAAFLGRAERFVHGTTLATNVLLTKRGAETGLITTAGFRDVIQMRRGIRNLGTSMFDQFRPPYEPLVPRSRRLGVAERTLATGAVETAVDEAEVEAVAGRLVEDGCESLAIGFLHSYVNPENERRAKAAVERAAPGAYVVCSHETLSILGEFERFSTTVVSAYVGPAVSAYLGELERRLGEAGFDGSLLIVISSGLMQTVEECRMRGAELLVSGPAAAPTAAIAAAAPLGYASVLEVDMGGTSFEVCMIREATVPTTREAFIGEERVATETVDVNSIGAGGGSIARIDGLGLLAVGPRSAGADPGPVAYGKGTEPTVTDADLVLGYVPADYFLGGELRLDVDRAEAAIAELGAGLGLGAVETAEAIFETVTTSMANAVTEVSTKKGHDVRRFTMVAGGGAGGIHGAAIAHRLGIPSVIFPLSGPVLSAMGMLTMAVGQELSKVGVWDRLTVAPQQLEEAFAMLEAEAREHFARLGVAASDVALARSLSMRYLGQFHEVRIAAPAGALDAAAVERLREDFHACYLELYGYSLPWRGVEILEAHLRATAEEEAAAGVAPPGAAVAADLEAARAGERSCLIGGERREVPVFHRDRLGPGHAFEGPALIDSEASTILVPAEFAARVDERLNIVLEQRRGAGAGVEAAGDRMTMAS
ncbi:MAG: hydantoinase/oxoprolinase family protein [Solirubrobacterales bacterium]